MKALNYFQKLQYKIELARMPITAMYVIVLIGALFMQSTVRISLSQALLCIALFTVYSLLHWYSDSILVKMESLYFYLQGFIILICAVLMPDASPLIVLGLMPGYIIQGLYFFRQVMHLVSLVLGYMCFYIAMMYIHFGSEYLWLFIALFVGLFVFLNLILFLFNQKDVENMELQYYIGELEAANQKIEQLTLQHERERMARDLHDTLAQRLVGLSLKLDASEAHLRKGNIEKSATIIMSAKEQLHESLAEARQVIDDLRRAKSDISFTERVAEEMAQLQYVYSLPIQLTVGNITCTAVIEEHILSILKEAVTNVYKHAEATAVSIAIRQDQGKLLVKIVDDGKGIDIDFDLQKQGHYGILGMKERVRLMKGQVAIEKENGTCITLRIPLE